MANDTWGIDERAGRYGPRLRVRVQHKGQKYSETIDGSFTDKVAVSKAKKLRDQALARMTLGLQNERTTSQSLNEVAQDYMDTCTIQASSRKQYKRILNTYWMPLYPAPIDQIRPDDVRKVMASMTCGPKTKANNLAPLSSVFEHAKLNGLVNANPCKAVKLPKIQHPPTDYFTPEEKQKLLDELAGEYLNYFIVFFGTGMRPSEILALNRHDIQGDYARVEKGMVYGELQRSTKNYLVRDVYLEPHVQTALKRQMLRHTGERIFQWTQEVTPHHHYRRAMSKARLRYRAPYKCRHTRAAELLTKGVKPAWAAKQLGHTLKMFFERYASWIDDDDSSEIAKLAVPELSHNANDKGRKA